MAGSSLFPSHDPPDRECLCLDENQLRAAKRNKYTHMHGAHTSYTYHECFQNRLISLFPAAASSCFSSSMAWLLTSRLFGFANFKIVVTISLLLVIVVVVDFLRDPQHPRTFVRNAYNAALYCEMGSPRDVRGDTDASWVAIGEIRRGASRRGLGVTFLFVKIIDIYVWTLGCF